MSTAELPAVSSRKEPEAAKRTVAAKLRKLAEAIDRNGFTDAQIMHATAESDKCVLSLYSMSALADVFHGCEAAQEDCRQCFTTTLADDGVTFIAWELYPHGAERLAEPRKVTL